MPACKGTMVKIASPSGFVASTTSQLKCLVLLETLTKTRCPKVALAQVTTCTSGSGANKDVPLGMLLYDVREDDENGEKLIFNPRKAAENDYVISGQAVPILTRGIVLYSGATLAADTVNPGDTVYAAAAGELAKDADYVADAPAVGKALGMKDANNHILLKIEL